MDRNEARRGAAERRHEERCEERERRKSVGRSTEAGPFEGGPDFQSNAKWGGQRDEGESCALNIFGERLVIPG